MTWKRLGTQIVGQTTETEVIVTDLQNGVYHSISGSGALMWDSINRGYSREQIVQMLDSAYEAPSETLSQAVAEFVDTLVGYDLIKPSDESSAASVAPNKTQGSKKVAFTPPTIIKFLNTDALLAEKSISMKWEPSVQCVVSENTLDQVVLVIANKRISYKITGAGALIWKCISAAQAREKMLKLVSASYDATAEVISEETDRFVTKLASLGLIQPVDGESSKPMDLNHAPETEKKSWASPAVAVDVEGLDVLKLITQLTGWQCASPRVVAETIDNEVIAVDLQAGIYHSITGPGALIWEVMNQGYNREQIVQKLLAHYDTTADVLEREIDQVIAKLVDYDLIRPRHELSTVEKIESKTPAAKERFEPSEVTIYNDMEDVLKLDPVHDFEEYGWPKKD